MGTFTFRSTFLYEFYIRTNRSVHLTFQIVSLLSPFNLRSLKVLSYEINIFMKVHTFNILCLFKHFYRKYLRILRKLKRMMWERSVTLLATSATVPNMRPPPGVCPHYTLVWGWTTENKAQRFVNWPAF